MKVLITLAYNIIQCLSKKMLCSPHNPKVTTPLKKINQKKFKKIPPQTKKYAIIIPKSPKHTHPKERSHQNMKTIIIYSTKTGTTKKCANILAQNLKDAATANINTIQNEDIQKYDLIIIGTPIRIGLIDKKIKNFILKNQKILKTKKTAYYICCAFNENWKQYFEQNIPKEILENAITYNTFGGELNIEKQKGIDKLICKIVTKNMDKTRQIKILNENIQNFINICKNSNK